MQPLVSLILLSYNRETFLAEAIASILAQTYQNFELVIWDDGSSDRSLEIAQAAAQRDSRVRVVAGERCGNIPAVRVQAIAQTSGQYLGWVDSDDRLTPTALERTVAVLEARPAVGMVYTDHMVMNAAGDLEEYGQRSRIPYSRDRLLVDFITFHFRLLRRDVYDQIGGIDTSCEYAYDYDLCLRLSEVTEVHHLPLPLYHYRQYTEHQSHQHRIEQIWGSRDVINRAIVRRGLSDRVQLDVLLHLGSERPGATFRLIARKPKSAVNKPLQWASAFLAALPLAGSLGAPVLAQSITPANDGTGTVVNQNGNQYDIMGGERSQGNLFHSLERLGLSRDEIANFRSDAEIRNILTRVVGGDASVIDGILRVSGGDANLFILNPAGIIFGRNAQLDLAGSFTASTATGLGFDNGWFNVNGTPNYSTLTGNPTNFAFATLSPGVVLNAGNLEVGAGESLTLLGGTVINTGRAAAPGGTVTIAAVEGQNRVRLSQEGSLLSLEVTPLQPNTRGVSRLPFTPLSLPELLTGGTVNVATGISTQPDGTVRLSGSQTVIPTAPGTAIVSGQVVAASNQAGATPEINVLGDRVALLDANLDARSPTGGGTVRVGGAYQGEASLPSATVTVVDSGSTINASATQNGNGGNVVLWADDLTLFQGNIQARGNNGNGGFVEVSGAQDLIFQGQVDVSATNGTTGTLLLDPTNILISNAPSNPVAVDAALPSIFAGDFPGQSVTINATTLQNQLATIVLEATNDIRVADGLSLNFTTSANGITFRADSDNSGAGGFFMDPTQSIFTNGRDLTITGATIVAGNLNTSVPIFSNVAADGTAGNLRLQATGDITTERIIATGGGYGGAGGQVSLVSPQGDITVRSIDVEGFSGFSETPPDGGQVFVNADLFRVTDTVNVESEVSIQAPRGSVNIIHRGGSENIPFQVSQGSTVLNGTAGTIVAGTGDDLTSGTYPVLENGGNAPLPPTVNGIRIRSVNNAPTLTGPNSQTFSTTVNQSITIKLSDLLIESEDIDGDRTTTRYEVAALPAGASLTVNGVPVQPGDTFDADAELVFTPPPGFTGTLEGFALRVSDLSNGEPVLATSEPFTVSFRVNPEPITPVDPVDPGEDPDPEVNDFPEPPEIYNDPNLDNPFVPPSTGVGTVIDCCMNAIERQYNREFTDYLGLAPTQTATVEQAETIAQDIEQATGARPAFVYISFIPPESTLRDDVPVPQDTDQLELVIVTAKGGLVRYRVPEATRSQVMDVVRTFRNDITNPLNLNNTRYRTSGQQLYTWFISPILADLRRLEITNLVFLPEAGLRSLPYSALYDGEQFLIEQFSIGLMPSISLTDTRYVDIRDSSMLAMGVAESTQGQTPLPAVPLEVDTLALQVWGGKVFLNDESTLENLQQAREQQPFGIIHLATHADFVAGDAGESYIQLWNERLRMDQVRELGWNNPPVELLVLSACRTALGNEQAELGFAGLAIQSGVKSAVASLWYVSDAATAALMARFYEGLQVEPIKAEALRQAQVAMARGEVSVDANGQLVGLGKIESLRLPPESARDVLGQTLSHPYYWAAFTLIGNPW